MTGNYKYRYFSEDVCRKKIPMISIVKFSVRDSLYSNMTLIQSEVDTFIWKLYEITEKYVLAQYSIDV